MRHAPRCFGVACSRRGNQASGTPRVRPSESSTHILSSSNLTVVALTEEVVPSLFDALTVRLDQFQQLAQRPCVEAVVVGNRYFRAKPNLACCSRRST